jgi:carbon-monoxide dehydrogenase catalytic subunit
MGPCRVPKPKKEGDPQKVGLCGATAETIAARNFARMVAAGSAAHSDHGRGVAEVFLMAAKGEIPGYGVKDEQKLLQVAMDFDIDVENKEIKEIAIELGELCIAEFGKQEGELTFIKRAPLKRQELWRKQKMVPRGIDREIVELMHRTHMGVDQDYKNITTHAARAALGDGWGGAMIATELQDIMFGTPVPINGEINLGVLKEDEVNIIVHGHEPLLSEMVVVASQDPEMGKGSEGDNAGRDVLYGKRDTGTPRDTDRGELSAAGGGNCHRSAGCPGGGRAVYHAAHTGNGPALSHRGDYHLAEGEDRKCPAHPV